MSPLVNLTVSSATAGYANNLAQAIFYKTLNNIWCMRFNTASTLTYGTTVTITIAGVSMLRSPCQGTGGLSGGSTAVACTNSSATDLVQTWVGASTVCVVTGDFILTEKPTAYLPDGV